MRRAGSVLQLHLPPGWPVEDGAFRFARYDGRDRTIGCASIADLAPASTVIAVVPAGATSIMRVRLPRVRGRRLAAALPLAVEDGIASSPEDVHAVLVAHVPEGESLVAVVDRTWLNAVRSTLAARGLAPDRMLIETELAAQQAGLAAEGRRWIAVLDVQAGFLRLPAGDHIALDGDAMDGVPWALSAAIDADRRPDESIDDELVVFANEATRRLAIEAWPSRLGVAVRDGGPWQPESIDARRLRATDLLRGAPALATGARRSRPKLLAVGIAAALVLGVHAVLTVADWWRLSREATRLQADMEAQFLEVFPEARNVVDAPLQMKRKLADLRAEAGIPEPTDFMPMLAAIAGPLRAAGATASDVRYERGALAIQFSLPAAADTDALARQLVVPGYRVRIERAAHGSPDPSVVLHVTVAS
jgi:general secretion pathway protein L